MRLAQHVQEYVLMRTSGGSVTKLVQTIAMRKKLIYATKPIHTQL